MSLSGLCGPAGAATWQASKGVDHDFHLRFIGTLGQGGNERELESHPAIIGLGRELGGETQETKGSCSGLVNGTPLKKRDRAGELWVRETLGESSGSSLHVPKTQSHSEVLPE